MGSRFGPQPILEVGVLNGYDDRTIVDPFVFGYNANVSGFQGIWTQSSAFVFPAVAGTALRIVSSSANDTGAGTGAQTVLVVGLTPTFAIDTFTATMTGAVPVNPAKTWSRLLFAQVLTTGATGSNEGNITVTNAAGTSVFERIQIGQNRSASCRWTCPATNTFFATGWGGSIHLDTEDPLSLDIEKRFFLAGTWNQFSGAQQTQFGMMDTTTLGQNWSFYRKFTSPRRLFPGTDIFVNCQAVSGGNARASGYIEIQSDDR